MMAALLLKWLAFMMSSVVAMIESVQYCMASVSLLAELLS
jgi:hypothetical protein